MKIVIIGSGNVATTLGMRAKESGHRIQQVFGRTPASASALAAKLNSEAISDVNALFRNADLYIVAISDDALKSVSSWLRLDKQLVVHTAGSVSKTVLANVTENFGVIYPLQSLRKERLPDITIPLLIDANNPEGLGKIASFANSISDLVKVVEDGERQKLHVGATITNNFVNHLYTLTADYCRKEGIDFQLLYPLINETGRRMSVFPPAMMQTGPAMRKDDETINRHLSHLQDSPELKTLYELFTELIEAYYK